MIESRVLRSAPILRPIVTRHCDEVQAGEIRVFATGPGEPVSIHPAGKGEVAQDNGNWVVAEVIQGNHRVFRRSDGIAFQFQQFRESFGDVWIVFHQQYPGDALPHRLVSRL